MNFHVVLDLVAKYNFVAGPRHMRLLSKFWKVFSITKSLLKKVLPKVGGHMQLLLIAQTPLCLLGTAKINFCLHFECYDLTNGVT